jgi:CubicO group peptidase (beta-lactamase class C family)
MMKAAPSVVLLFAAWLCLVAGQDVRVLQAGDAPVQPPWDWATASPESEGTAAARLEAAWTNLKDRHTTAFVVIHNDKIVLERYASGYSRSKPHGTASMAKALVGGVALMVAMEEGRIGVDDPAWKYVPQWRNDPKRKKITVRHLVTHTAGIEDAEADGSAHARLTGWKGDFWRRLPPSRDPFTIARDLAPVLDAPGTIERYSNPGMAMLGYCVTASLRATEETDLRSLLKQRIMERLGVPDGEWSVGYGTTFRVDGLPLVATWGGGDYSPNALARVGRLMLHKGNWEGKQLVSPSVVEAVTRHSGLPGHSGLGWWVNAACGNGRLWRSAPEDAFGGAGAGQQFLLVVPSLNLIVVRNGEQLDENLSFWQGLEKQVVAPVMQAFAACDATQPILPTR